MDNILEKIVNRKKESIKIYKKNFSENKLIQNIKNINSFVNFLDKLKSRNLKKKFLLLLKLKKPALQLV